MTHHAQTYRSPGTLRRAHATVLSAVLAAAALVSVTPQLTGDITAYTDFEKVFGYNPKEGFKNIDVNFVKSSAPGNVFWPSDEADFDFQVVNKTDQPIKAAGRFEIVEYSTRCVASEPFAPAVVAKVADGGSAPVSIEVAAKGYADVKAKLPLPAKFGAYAIVLALEGQGRQVVATCLRTIAASPERAQFPVYAIDMHGPEQEQMFQRVGVRGTRQEMGTVGPEDKHGWDEIDKNMKSLMEHNITLMVTVGTGGDYSKMPLGHIRGFLNDKAEGKMEYPGDFVCLPEYDGRFQEFVKTLLERYGWPKGPINAIELWNEPWEGISISGWGADMPRFRELYTRMAMGAEEARKSGVQVLIGGACSSMNTEDKLFGDGKDEPFLKWQDFTSIHYQPMCTQPALIKRFAQRKSPQGPTRAWDTESWIANSEDRIAGVIAGMRATGLDRTAGVLHDSVRSAQEFDLRLPDGKTQRITTVQALAPAGGIAALDAFMGQRPFREVLFKNGLPWVFVFDGIKNDDDGTVVVVGDLGGVYERGRLLFRGVLGLKARERSIVAKAKLDAVPADAPITVREEVLKNFQHAEVLDNAAMTISDGGGHFVPLDFMGNPLKPGGGKIVVPLNGLGFYLRTDGSAGSFAKLIEAIKVGRVEGLEPVDVVAHDLLGRVDSKPALRLTITNILNRPIAGKLDVKLGGLKLDGASQDLKLAANETLEITVKIAGGSAAPDNTYALSATFDAGADGKKLHTENMHVNVIAHKTINVDGNLDEWKDVLAQPIRSSPGSGKNLTEKAWLPFGKFDDNAGAGYASGYMAYDERYFYFAAKIADSTPDEGTIRFEKRDDNKYYYPDVAYDVRTENGKEVRTEYKWPAGVRHFSYRMNPEIPSQAGDSVQLGFNVLPVEKTDWLPFSPGTMPRFQVYKSTDYEYTLNTVAPAYGGGTELWRLLAPGVPRKHFYPRQDKAEKDGGPVADGKLVTKREGNTRLVECAIPWSELPHVKKNLDAGKTVKFTFRVNDNKGPSYELNGERSVSKIDTYALHDFWQNSWATETEFSFEK
jgi:hypothetical protein